MRRRSLNNIEREPLRTPGLRENRAASEKTVMTRALLVMFGLTCTVAVGHAAPGPLLDFTLVNKTGLTILEVYVSPTSDDEWGEDVMGRDVLGDDEAVEITFSRRETECVWDLRVVDDDRDAVVWKKLNLCEASEITLKYEGKRPTAIVK